MGSSILSNHRTHLKGQKLIDKIELNIPAVNKILHNRQPDGDDWNTITTTDVLQHIKQINTIHSDNENKFELLESIQPNGSLTLNQTKTNLKGRAGLFLFEAQITDLQGKNVKIKVMYDTGATSCFMAQRLTKKAVFRTSTDPKNTMSVKVADGTIHKSNTVVHTILKHKESEYAQPLKLQLLDMPMDIDLILGHSWQDSLDNGAISSSTHHKMLSFNFKGNLFVSTPPHTYPLNSTTTTLK